MAKNNGRNDCLLCSILRSVIKESEMKVELTKEDIQNLIRIINATQITGGQAEAIIELKQKLAKGEENGDKV